MTPRELFSQYELAIVALTLWREARGCPYEVQLAVACSIRNRVRRPSWWGKTYAEVCLARLQYSSMTYPKDPQLTRFPKSVTDEGFGQCLEIARRVMRDEVDSPVPGADSYFDDSIPPPTWATPDKFVAKLGRISFYNMDRDVERSLKGDEASS